MPNAVLPALLCLVLLAPSALAEGVWRVKGHSFTNVHAWQKGRTVQVGGRVSGGPARAPFQAVVHVQNDEGKTHRANIRMESFTGRGETFEAAFTATRRARWWKVTQIEVVGADPDLIESRPTSTHTSPVPGYPSQATALPDSGAPKCFPAKAAPARQASRVLFSSMNPVCVTIRDRQSGRLVLMKNVSPHELLETSMPCGQYSARIVGDGFTTSKDFEIAAESEMIDLN